jgi:tetratricopeptide (TPR) repeat protein
MRRHLFTVLLCCVLAIPLTSCTKVIKTLVSFISESNKKSVPAQELESPTLPAREGVYSTYELELMTRELLDLMEAGRYDEVESFFGSLRDDRVPAKTGFAAAEIMLNRFCEWRETGPLALAWIEEDPDAEIAHLLYGAWCVDEAWRYRGGSWAVEVSSEGWESFGGYLKKAREHLMQAYKLDDQDYLACGKMITVCMGQQTGQREERLWFQRATRIYPDYYVAYDRYMYALLPRWGGEPGQALEVAKANRNRSPLFPMLTYSWLCREEEEQLENPDSRASKTAFAILEKYMEAYPESGKAYRDYGAELHRVGRSEEGLDYARKAVEVDPQSNNRYNYAELLYDLGQWRESIEQLEVAVELSPGNSDYWYLLGNNYLFTDGFNPRKAVESFTQAIELEPGWRLSWVRRGRAYLCLRKYDEAVADFREVTQRWPGYGRGFYYLGTALYERGEREEAQRAFKQAVKVDPDLKADVNEFTRQHGR